MQYVQPYGISDANGGYVNGDRRVGRQGSIPPAAAFEHPMREIVNLITYAGLTPDGDDLKQLTKGVRRQSLNYAVDTGSTNVLAVAYDPTFSQLTYGLILRVMVAHTCTGPATISVNSMGAVAIHRASGAVLEANDLVAGQVVTLVYDGSFFQIVNYFGTNVSSSTTNTYDIAIPYTVDTSGVANTITAVFNPSITSLSAGDLIEVKIANANTGATTITVNSLPSKNVKAGDGSALIANQIVIGMIALLVYDGTNFQLINPCRANVATSGGIGIAKRYMYQDPNYHITSIYNSYVEAFRVTYVPVTAGNTLRIQLVGSFNSSETTERPIGRAINGYIAYSTDGGTTWNPASWPGRDYRTTGTFMANPAMAEIVEGTVVTAGINRIDFNFNILGELTVPAGPPANIIVKMMFTSAYQDNLTTMVHGGTIVEITEYIPAA